METPEEEPAAATTIATPVVVEAPRPSTVSPAGWSAQRSPQPSMSTTSSAIVDLPSSDTLPPVRLKSALKVQAPGAAPVRASRAVAGAAAVKVKGEVAVAVGKQCHEPVAARTAKDMVGAHTERSTGITYPYNMWGPCNPTRFGPVGEMPPDCRPKYNYQGKHEALMKDRLEERDFGHVRHHCYRKNLVEPTGAESLAWQDPKRKDLWRTDVHCVLQQDEEKRRARQKELLEIMSAEEAWRRQHAEKLRDMKYAAFEEMSHTMQAKVGCRNNLSGAPHINIITREPIGEHNIKAVKFRDDCSQYKRAQRTLMLRERNSGARNYNILNWTENPPGPELPPWPEKPPTPPPPPPPDTRTPLNSSKGVISCGRVFGPFGKFNIP